jgi:hypothetical protein
MTNLATYLDAEVPCRLCQRGFPLVPGTRVHHGTQALGMIPDTPCTVSVREVRLVTMLRRASEALGFIESAALFHPEQAWPDELKAQLRRIGKISHEALAALDAGAGGRSE